MNELYLGIFVFEEPASRKVDPGKLIHCFWYILKESLFCWFGAGQVQVFSNSNDDFAQQGDSFQFYLPNSLMLDVRMPRNVCYNRSSYNSVFADHVRPCHCEQLLVIVVEELNNLVNLQVPLKQPVLVGSEQESVELLLVRLAFRCFSHQIFVAKQIWLRIIEYDLVFGCVCAVQSKFERFVVRQVG